ncbi:MAG: imidazolonepropionase-like amidohydrolase [Parvicellaceae bacterium]|jgi:imidazolonepropionase-like amidohydrolase
MKFKLLIALLCVQLVSFGQDPNLYPTNGVKHQADIYYAFTNATIHTSHATSVKGTLLVRNGKIEKVGAILSVPKGAVTIDLKGKHIYPSFIDMFSNYGQPEAIKEKRNPSPQIESKKKGAFGWNQAIKPEYNSSLVFVPNDKNAKEYRAVGFGTVLTHNMDGISRGTSSLVSLNQGSEGELLLKPIVAAHSSFSKGTSRQSYPSSLMGTISLLRQTHYDAIYYKKHKADLPTDLSLEAFQNNLVLPQIMDANDKLNIVRADTIGDEFGYQYIFKGSGNEYQRIAELKATKGAIIIPLNFPKPYDVSDPYSARLVSLAQMKHWELAPGNAKALSDEQIEFAFTLNGLKKKTEFWLNIRKTVARGLSASDALKGLTSTPAKLLGVENLVGGLREGLLANFLITSDEIFKEKTIIYENWIQGDQFILNPKDVLDVRGTYNLKVDEQDRTLEVGGSLLKPKASIEYSIVADSVSESGDLVLDDVNHKPVKITKTKKVKGLMTVKDRQVALTYKIEDNFYSLSGIVHSNSGIWEGKGTLPNGSWVKWAAVKKDDYKDKSKKKPEKMDTTGIGGLTFPMLPYGWDSLPAQRQILIKNATIWTNEAEGILAEKDILIQNGKIKAIGDVLDVVDQTTIVIDGQDKHVTPGIVDEHSHIAISRGVNESGQASSAEASIATVVNSDDINIYRQLAGGVTSAQLLHGSANPIGGQSAVIKLKWGWMPEQMKYQDMPLFIKFALGENVKQSNWGSYNTIRFPQSRMGVEQLFYDHFIRAKEYRTEWDAYNELLKNRKKAPDAIAPRRDLELDALAEIVNKERFISCHSYVQSEINMLMKVADSMGFTLNTFTHILEGYKVADKMKAHGAGGSTFSDWWAYKYEVRDAIPHNASLLHEMGIVTAINSDDAEMARRLNQEAAKSVKYGGMSEEDALKLVTLNPAKLLHIDDRVGSLKVGKDADIVVWSGHPLSVYSKPTQTIVDGYVLFDEKRDLEMRKELAEERARLIAKMLKAKLGGADTQAPSGKKNRVHNCNIITDDGY